ncbi:multicopper oxidase domain-containing protein [Gulosibacter chungangensis]|uniref:Copper-containing nitrite reductase n=2 Tax=Gulosibacter chungangensis TaxID=979746 RepID=A0A7J5BGH8_9MICO|nr:multicopper oxidase domain-containing protein [Gulosibacter chungangensis]
MRDIPTALWLLLALIATFVHRGIPEPRWLMIHLLLLGAITHAILTWSEYFSFALLRTRATRRDQKLQNIRLTCSNLGAVLVFIGVPTGIWALTAVGSAALIVAVLWHGWAIVRRARGSLPGKFGKTIRYYVASAGLLAIGAVLGAIVARGDAAPQLALSHALINVLGWVGLTVAGTVVTLWPTILRTRADEHAATWAMRALPVLAVGVLVAALGAALALMPLLAVGLAGYLAGLGMLGVSLVRAARNAPPRSFAALSVGCALLWWFGCVAVLMVGTITKRLTGGGFEQIQVLIDGLVPYLAAGFAAQVLVGALSYLVPVVLGGGPRPVRIGTVAFDRLGTLRVTVANAALVVCALPVSSLMRVVASLLYVIAMGSFLVNMFPAMRAQRKAKQALAGKAATRAESAGEAAASAESAGKVAANVKPARTAAATPDSATPKPARPERAAPEKGRRAGQAMAGLVTVLLAAVITASLDPIGVGWGAGAAGDADAPVTTIQVDAADMTFTPNVLEVPAGNRLVVELTNTDASQVHDLVFANGVTSGRLAPGESETIDFGVLTEDLDGWCSIVGHRQMGMTLTVKVTGAVDSANTADGADSSGADDTSDASAEDGHSMADMDMGGVDLTADPGAGFTPFAADLPPLPAADGPTTHEVTLTVTDEVLEVAPGVTQTLWVYNGSAPGPTLHGRVGDTFVVTLVNYGNMGHSIDFHAGALAPDEPMRTIAPGEQLTYTFTATRAGIWMYHCSTMPMSAHIANGMYGAVVIEPDDLPAVDRSYVLVQGEYYLGDHEGGEVDMTKIEDRAPDLVVFNGYANQYDHAPLEASVGERVRIWVLDAGIERPSSFHIVGGQFDTVWKEGAYSINNSPGVGAQALDLLPAQGGFVELSFPEAGNYPFVSHLMIDAEHGAHGVFAVSP